MKKLSGVRGAGVIGAGVAVLALVALYLAGVIGPTPEPAGNVDAPQPATDAARQPAPPPQESAAQTSAATLAPQIDIFRLQPDGEALIAGQGVPGSTVQILLDGVVQTIAEPASDGRFAVFLSLPPAADPRLLSLRMVDSEGGTPIDGTQQIIVAPASIASKAEPAVTALAEPAPSVDAEATVPATPPPAGTAVTGAGETPAPAEPADPPQIVLMTDADGARVLQSPDTAAPQVLSNVALDTISYSEDGDVQLAGRAAGQGTVRVYLDNRPIATSRIAADGTWRTALPQVDTGIYTLRIDEVTGSGTVTSRIETPFKREDRALLAELQDPAAAGQEGSATKDPPGAPPAIRVVTVQPGNTLWAISRETYGEGLLYVRVFEANAERIRDPDLIYPGQVFTLPD
ncbi:MAG TPA: LysM peptidoglycan-binding domain-containing protein [Roseovarius sp.]